ncbi:hypothetical protein [Rhizobium sp. L1K21]|uniref:hypothetical protein n=1 Tax=Rhizobium sp. L1K21 TaxID=2954933 RepID=UPI002093499B|nr:hypothetical protein [Rhizobium sp. L1K21]MCO6188657.1 hypothetical protein [Rhizobium sp. L1K21]
MAYARLSQGIADGNFFSFESVISFKVIFNDPFASGNGTTAAGERSHLVGIRGRSDFSSILSASARN